MKTAAEYLFGFSRNIEAFNLPCEKITKSLPAKRNFNVKIRNRKDWEENGLLNVPNWTLSCFTDGSRIDGNAGASYFISEIEEDIVIPLGRYPTVYQAEIIGITYAARDLGQNELDYFERVDLFVDSLSTLQTLSSTKPVTELVWECFSALEELAKHREVTLNWIPAHRGLDGNEKADELAKLAARTEYLGPQPSILVASQFIKTAIKEWAKGEHSSRWKESTKCKNTDDPI